MAEATIKIHAAFIWSVADLLRGDYKQSEYGKVILPLTVLRRLDCVLEPTKAAVLARAQHLRGRVDNPGPALCNDAGQPFYNTSPLTVPRLLDDSAQMAGNLRAYIAGFSEGARDVLDKFDFDTQITRLDRADLLYRVLARFAEIDLHPDVVSNLEMGYLYEELIRRFSELSNETAGEHFTPREVIRLMVNLLFAPDDEVLTGAGIIRTLYDPACGTGGMLSVAEDHLRSVLDPGRTMTRSMQLQPSSSSGITAAAPACPVLTTATSPARRLDLSWCWCPSWVMWTTSPRSIRPGRMLRPGPRRWGRQPAQPGWPPDRLPVGAGVGPGRLDGPPGPLHTR